jgi:hypothetical protein
MPRPSHEPGKADGPPTTGGANHDRSACQCRARARPAVVSNTADRCQCQLFPSGREVWGCRRSHSPPANGGRSRWITRSGSCWISPPVQRTTTKPASSNLSCRAFLLDERAIRLAKKIEVLHSTICFTCQPVAAPEEVRTDASLPLPDYPLVAGRKRQPTLDNLSEDHDSMGDSADLRLDRPRVEAECCSSRPLRWQSGRDRPRWTHRVPGWRRAAADQKRGPERGRSVVTVPSSVAAAVGRRGSADARAARRLRPFAVRPRPGVGRGRQGGPGRGSGRRRRRA